MMTHGSIPVLLRLFCIAACMIAVLALPYMQAEGVSVLTKPPNNLGLVGYWSFNEGTGTIATDFSGQGNRGVISGASWVSGKRNKALQFDGSDDYVRMDGTSLAAPTDWTVALWVKRTGDGATAEDFNSILTRGEVSGYPRNYRLPCDHRITCRDSAHRLMRMRPLPGRPNCS